MTTSFSELRAKQPADLRERAARAAELECRELLTQKLSEASGGSMAACEAVVADLPLDGLRDLAADAGERFEVFVRYGDRIVTLAESPALQAAASIDEAVSETKPEPLAA